MHIDHRLLRPETLRSLIEGFILREGTDYGDREASLEAKVTQVMRAIDQGKVKLVFDPETETCDLREVSALERQERAREHAPAPTRRPEESPER